nr:DUF2079 domain-containing protein [Natrinema pallidum]
MNKPTQNISNAVQKASGRRYSIIRRLTQPKNIVWPLTSLIFLCASVYTVSLHNSFKTGALDLGQYVGAFWTTLHTDQFFYSPLLQQSYFARHFAPINFVTIMWYSVFSGPEYLLIFKSLLLALSFAMLWYVADKALDSGWLALGIAFGFISNRYLVEAWLFDYQEQVFLPVLLFSLYFAYKQRAWRAFTILSILTYLTNEFIVILFVPFLLGLALEEWHVNGDSVTARRLLLLAGVGVLYFGFTVWAMEYFSQAGQAQFGTASPSQISQFTNPEVLISQLIDGAAFKIEHLILFLAPMLFIAFLDITFIFSLSPYLLYAWLLTSRNVYAGFGAHYSLYILPFAAIGLVRALEKMNLSHSTKRYLALTMAVMVVFHAGLGAVFVVQTEQVPDSDEHIDAINQQIELVPDDASISTLSNLQPHLAEREHSYMTPPHGELPDYVLIDTTSYGDWYSFDLKSFNLADNYALVSANDGVWLFERNDIDQANQVSASQSIPISSFEVRGAQISDGMIVRDDPSKASTVWYGPYQKLPGGNYTITYEIRVKGDGYLKIDAASGNGKEVLKSKQISPTDKWTTQSLSFNLEEPNENLEYRGIANGQVTVEVKNITITRHR